MKLNHTMPRCTPTLRDRIERALEEPTCNGYRCGGAFAALRRRMVGGNETLHLQCTTCGRSLSGSLPKRECFDFSSLDLWDHQVIASWDAQRKAESDAVFDALRIDNRYRLESREARRRRYSEWLRTSPEWRAIRNRVMRRANYV